MGLDIAKASLHELGQIESDSIIVGEIDDKLVDLPSYRELYHRWEKQQWSTQDLDFSIDRQNWAGVSEENRPVWISGFVVFFQGEVSVVNTLIPYLAAAPTEEQRIFLTTQLADEARHATFFDKFFREALLMDGPDIESILVKIRPLLLPAQREILMEGLAEVGQKIHDEPKNMAYLVEGVTLYHIITEGTLALAGQRNMLNRNKRLGWYPGFQQGFTAVARDESRHVLFGVRFLRDMVQQDQAHAGTIRNTIARWLPQIRETLYLSEMQRAVLTAFGEDPNDVINFGMSSLRKKLKVIGVKHNF
ncbi:MAG TPA: ribonucleotide-diphosphate reductase subunit beta [Ktedonobacteraceae bacterium]|nr:ribonucleotide-diphosphate reductase subunit beta [Ktedonobacteraceae bacterium]